MPTTPTNVPVKTTAVPSVTTPNSGSLPSQILNLTNWKITLPIDGKGDTIAGGNTCTAEEITQPSLSNFSINPWFAVNPLGDAVTRVKRTDTLLSEISP